MRVTGFAMLILSVLAPASASADAFCDNLKAIAATGSEADPFKSIRGAKGDDGAFEGKRLLPGFSQCRTDSSQYACHHMDLTATTASKVEADAKAAVEACFGGTMVRDDERTLEPYSLNVGNGDVPVVLVNNIGDQMVSVTYIVK